MVMLKESCSTTRAEIHPWNNLVSRGHHDGTSGAYVGEVCSKMGMMACQTYLTNPLKITCFCAHKWLHLAIIDLTPLQQIALLNKSKVI